MATKRKTQTERLLNHLNKTGKITAEQAEKKFGTKNLRARINDFRQNGMNIQSVRNPKNPSTVVYTLVG